MKHAWRALAAMLLASWLVVPATAGVELVETCTDTLDTAVVTWDCDFQDTSYTSGTMVTFTVNWSASTTASFDDFTLRGHGFTPRSKIKDMEGDPELVGEGARGFAGTVDGSDVIIESVVDGATGSVTISIMLDDLHKAGKKGKKGNAHFSLFLYVDDDGDGVLPERSSQFGVNLHVTEPAAASQAAGIEGLAKEEPIQSTTWGTLKRSFD